MSPNSDTSVTPREGARLKIQTDFVNFSVLKHLTMRTSYSVFFNQWLLKFDVHSSPTSYQIYVNILYRSNDQISMHICSLIYIFPFDYTNIKLETKMKFT